MPTFAKGGRGKEQDVRRCRWIVDTPLQVRAMLLACDRLFLGGWRDTIAPQGPETMMAGKQEGSLVVMSTADGKVLAEYKLPAPPVLDGLIAADDCLYVALRDGQITCFSE